MYHTYPDRTLYRVHSMSGLGTCIRPVLYTLYIITAIIFSCLHHTPYL